MTRLYFIIIVSRFHGTDHNNRRSLQQKFQVGEVSRVEEVSPDLQLRHEN